MAERRTSGKLPLTSRESSKVDSGCVQTIESNSDVVAGALGDECGRAVLPSGFLDRPSAADVSRHEPSRVPTTVPIQESGIDSRLVRRPACSKRECLATFETLQRENEELRKRLEASLAQNSFLVEENVGLRKSAESMQRRITCSEIVEGHSHLKEKCEELQEELETMKRLNRNAEVADQNKSERIDIFSTRLAAVKKKLHDKENYIELLHEQLAQVFVKLEIEKNDSQKLSEVKHQLERELHSAQAENQAYLEELREHLAQIRDMKDRMYTLREELEKERNIRREVIRKTSSKSKDRPLSVPVFAHRVLHDADDKQ